MKKDVIIESRFLNPLTDFGFQRLFGTESSKKFLISFLNEIIREESLITDIQYLPLHKEDIQKKNAKRCSIFSVRMKKGNILL